MDEDLAIINTNTRNEKIKKFFLKYKKIFTIFITVSIVSLISFFLYTEFKKREKIKISNLFNSTIINYSKINKIQTTKNLINIINKKDPTYSTLSLYFVIDNKLIEEKKRINLLFDILINSTPLESEIKNLVIYKKALFNVDNIEENELLKTLKPITNSESIWKPHALYLIAEYFYFKDEKQKSKDFFNQIINSNNANSDILQKAQKRLSRDLSD
ncbi:hypothetical protein IDH21_02215 [Pelagibacterales bacterium SAG-MED47]|nr:hypothetical protein [Pelagibacterales bacterium SAG-MED47]